MPHINIRHILLRTPCGTGELFILASSCAQLGYTKVVTFTEVVLLNHRYIVIITAIRLFTIISAFWQTNLYIPRFYVTILPFRERTLFRTLQKKCRLFNRRLLKNLARYHNKLDNRECKTPRPMFRYKFHYYTSNGYREINA